MKQLARHIILIKNSSREEATAQIQSFFDKTNLVTYDRITFVGDGIAGHENDFQTTLKKGLERNRATLAAFVSELRESGFTEQTDLNSMAQGYQSKLLHIIAHFLDGFIGIDSSFYNLIDDSHWLPENTATQIQERASSFWLFTIDCYSTIPRKAALLHM